jgi:CHASE2 domain-containing sensor protein
MDDQSFHELKQDVSIGWDRNLHAELLDRLTRDGVKAVVFDVVFDLAGDVTTRSNFVRAIRQNGRVVLAASVSQYARGQVTSPMLPAGEIMEAAAGWGVAAIHSDGDGGIARQYFQGSRLPSLPAAAVSILRKEQPTGTVKAREETWLNYYGKALTLPSVSYAQASSQPPGFFKDKVVFIGALPTTLKAFEQTDLVPTPYSRWFVHQNSFPGVEIGATEFLNLWRHESLRKMPETLQAGLILLAGLVIGATLGIVRPLPAAVLAALGALACLLVALKVAEHHVWFAWTVIVLVQIPVALVWSVRGHVHQLTFEKTVAQETLAETTKLATALKNSATAESGGLKIPDHTLIKCVGQGAYGEVWLARNAIGAYHAVKIVKRAAFSSDAPYEREFRGIQKFMPISRSHQGFVHILHVGRHDEGGYFFYIMEACDDASSGQKIDPASYSPKTLATELKWRGKLPPEDCLRLGLTLAEALEHLHHQQLIHRDIKPANIIYVNGGPKLADIGLVTEVSSEGVQVSALGTEGYVPPEGPGTAAADVYGLGKVLYEACMGRDRLLFPEVPTAVLEASDQALLKQLNRIICRACATDLNERYPSAAALQADLKELG